MAAATLLPGFSEQEVGSLWTEPVGIAFDPTPQGANRAYVWERAGRVWILENGTNSWIPLLDIRDEVGAWRDYGMLGFALDPNFQENGHFYVSYVVDRHHLLRHGTPAYDPAANEYLAATIGRVTRYTARASDGFRTADPASRRVLIGETITTGIPILHGSHGPGNLAFGSDGTLLVASGDAASWEGMDDGGPDGNSYAAQGLADGIIQPKEDVGSFRSQLLDSLSGKILRIDPATGNGVASNPFYDPAKPRAARSRVWTLGLRNPYRMTVRPDTGSHLPADADPGVIVLGDVGWETREEVHVITGAGQNCGWPLFEGLTPEPTYQNSPAENLDAPNPLGGYFRFKDLLVQETLGTPSWPNPRDPSQQVPASVGRFMHRRPVIDVGRDHALIGPARTGTFDGETATETKIGAPGSPVAGPQYLANTSTGGVFYQGSDFPAKYLGTYFHADYGQQWIKNIVFDANHRPVEVRDFATEVRTVYLATHPVDGSLYYVDMTIPAVRRIVYAPGGNRPPVARANADLTFGNAPLTVQFSSGGSSDPDGQTLTYRWDFGDGTTSTNANPAHTFTGTGTRRHDVRLTVTDSAGGSAEATVPVFVNHSLPVVDMVSPVHGTKYPLTGDTEYRLRRRVLESPGHPTTTRWNVYLQHDNHEHAEPAIEGAEATVTLSPVSSATAQYGYRIVVTVTDDLGAVVQREARVFPNSANNAPTVAWSISTQFREVDAGPLILDGSATAADPDSPGIESGELRITCSSATTIAIAPQGDGPGQVNLAGSAVLVGGIEVGRVTIGEGSLSVALNDAATPAAARSILRRVSASFIGAGVHTVVARLLDGDGAISPPASLSVNISDNQPPVVTLTAPVNGASFAAPARITLMANATDADGSVTKVEYFNGGIRLGEATSPPYSVEWSNVAAGDYSVIARATDNSGATADSVVAGITVTTSNRPPLVGLTAPLNGATFPAPANLTLAANASDPDGEITKVEFFNGALKLGVSRVPPYTFAWNNVPTGTYSLTARATDNLGATTTSQVSLIAVGAPGGLPLPWQSRDVGSAPVPGSAVFKNGRFRVTAAGRDISLNSDEFRYVWQPWTGDGDIVCRIDAIGYVSPGTIGGLMFREALGPKSRHVMIDLTAGAGAMMRHRGQTAGPTAEINGADEIAPHWLKLTRRGALFTGWISADGATWSPVGTVAISLPDHCLVGLATSAANGLINNPLAATTVAFSNVSVRAPQIEQLAVTLASPVAGSIFNPEASVLIEAFAHDPRGPIEKLEFFNDAAKIGELETAPFALAWDLVGAGAYTLRAKATGPGGSTATSPDVQFTVRDQVVPLPAPWEHQDIGAVTRAGDATLSGEIFTVSGSGLAGSSPADQFHYAWRRWTGDGTIVARVLTIGNSSAQAFAGVRFRETLAADSRDVLLSVRAGGGIAFQWRGRAGRTSKILAGPEVAAPRWLKLVRKGARFTGFISTDGINWRRVGRQTVAIPAECLVGVAACSGEEGTVTNAFFDAVRVSQP